MQGESKKWAPATSLQCILVAFGVALMFATLTTLHQVSMHTSASLRSAARS
jgi:hypothetical protein